MASLSYDEQVGPAAPARQAVPAPSLQQLATAALAAPHCILSCNIDLLSSISVQWTQVALSSCHEVHHVAHQHSALSVPPCRLMPGLLAAWLLS